MTTRLTIIDRLTIFVLGVSLLLAGLIPAGLYFDIPGVSEVLRGIDRTRLAELPYSEWYIWALVAGTALLVVIGVSMLATNLRSRSFSKREVTGETDTGSTTVHVAKLAQAIGNYLAQDEAINKVDTSVATVGKRPTITFTVDADPDAELPPIVALLESTELDFRDAVGDMDLDTVYKLHLSRVDP